MLDDTVYDAELTFVDHHTPVIEISMDSVNTYLPSEISLTKEMQVLNTVENDAGQVWQEMSAVPGAGFVFGLFNADDIPYPDGDLPAGSLIASGATNAEGRLTLNGCFPHGKYYLEELSVPSGWTLMQDVIPIELLPENAVDGRIQVTLEEPILNELICVPVSLMKTNRGQRLALPMCWLELSNEQGKVVYSGYTDENGCTSDLLLVPGKYTFREVLAPDGYELSVETLAFRVLDDGSVMGDLLISDDVTRFCVQKVDENHKPLAGTEFGLRTMDGSILMTAVSDENGYATFDMVPCGEYTIVELTPSSGYVATEVSVPVAVTPTFINPREPLAVIENCPNEVLLQKIDQSGNAV